MKRKNLSIRERVRLFDAAGGRCHVCARKINAGEAWDLDHVIALEISGDDTANNLLPTHVECHKIKTKRDQKMIARAYRVRARHLGIKKTKGRPIPGSRGSGIRKPMNGPAYRDPNW